MWIFEHSLWLLLCRVHQAKVLDFSGEYIGQIVAGEGQEDSEARLMIQQTWHRIKVTFQSGSASSKSFSAGFVFDRRGFNELELTYNYFTQGQTIQAHYGTATIRFKDDGSLTGEYFTEQDRDSFGQMALQRTKDRSSFGKFLKGAQTTHHTTPM